MPKAPRGMHDILPDDAARWRALEALVREYAARFGYGEIRTPVLEHTDVYRRTVGETTDIVEHEMYTFSDRGGRSLTLRPEGTAGVVRAYLEHGLGAWPQPVRLYYVAPMFRYDRPQKGRYRMHHQFGAEVLGTPSPQADVEVLSLPIRLIQHVGLTEVRVRLNTVGDQQCRPGYVEALNAYFRPHRDELCADCQRRLDANPLRILECKEVHCHELARGAPVITDYLCDACRAHFAEVRRLFEAIAVPFVEDPHIVRGLDYYTRTAAEIHSGRLGGAQHQVLGGGRYDGLAEQLGGPPTPGVGFGMGLERLMLVLEAEDLAIPQAESVRGVEVFVASVGEEAGREAFRLVDRLRAAGLSTVGEMIDRGLRAQLKQADRVGAQFAVILGERELAAGQAGVKEMRTGAQVETPLAGVVAFLTQRLRGGAA